MGGARALAAGMVLLFAGSAALQWNDPDPLRWMLLYGAGAVLSGLHLLDAAPAAALATLAAVAALWAASLLPGVVRELALAGSEEERELAGLLLVAVGMGALWRDARRRSDP